MAVASTLVIGDEIGGNNADVVRFGSTAGTANIGVVGVIVTSSGLLDMATNSKSNTLTTLTLETGGSSSGNVQISALNLTLGGNITTLVTGATTSTSPAATISGNGTGSVVLGAARTFAVNESPAAAELAITAPISSAFTITKTLEGTLNLGGLNTFTGLTLSAEFRRYVVASADRALERERSP